MLQFSECRYSKESHLLQAYFLINHYPCMFDHDSPRRNNAQSLVSYLADYIVTNLRSSIDLGRTIEIANATDKNAPVIKNGRW
jgi:hypothetical protein